MKLEARLDAVSRLRQDPATPEARLALRKYLADKSNLVVAKAAKIVAAAELEELVPELVEAFQTFMRDPAVTDKGCSAKIELVRAIAALGALEERVFLTGVLHVQLEPSFGKPIDTAAPLRAASGMGLVRMNHPDALVMLAALLADRELDARVGAVRAMAYSGKAEAMPLLRFKVLQGDVEPAVTAECFSALMQLEPSKSLEFVAGYLENRDPAVRESAAIALAESKHPAAVRLLIESWRPGMDETSRRALLTALSLARHENAFEFLFSLIAQGNERSAAEAIMALALYRRDERIRNRVQQLVEARQEKSLQRLLHSEFDR